jgi:alpha-tubulin suppressor-like RCC1 family protein
MYVPNTRLKMFDHIKIKSISCGRYHTLFLTQDGKLYACGQNKLGQLGIGRTRENDTAVSSQDVKMDLADCFYYPK